MDITGTQTHGTYKLLLKRQSCYGEGGKEEGDVGAEEKWTPFFSFFETGNFGFETGVPSSQRFHFQKGSDFFLGILGKCAQKRKVHTPHRTPADATGGEKLMIMSILLAHHMNNNKKKTKQQQAQCSTRYPYYHVFLKETKQNNLPLRSFDPWALYTCLGKVLCWFTKVEPFLSKECFNICIQIDSIGGGINNVPIFLM